MTTAPSARGTGVASQARNERLRAAPPMLELRGLTKRYVRRSDEFAVSGVDLEVRAGEFVSLLGPSGSGKTTTLRMIAGFESPESGSILVDGVDVVGLPPNGRPVNTVFQDYALFPHLDVRENVEFGLRAAKVSSTERDRRVRDALEMVSVAQFASRRPGQLSGGQRQRVALARALVMRPKVLLLDEPLGALDLKLRSQMQLALVDLCHELGISFLYVTHDQAEAFAMSDRVAVMGGGKIEQFSTPRELYEEPRTAFVAGFVGEMNFLTGTLAALPDDAGIARVQLDGGLHVVAASAAAMAGVRIGEAVRLASRPENIEIGLAHGANVLPGTISRQLFSYGETRAHIELAGGQTFQMRLARSDAEQYPDGTTIDVRFSEKHTRLFPA